MKIIFKKDVMLPNPPNKSISLEKGEVYDVTSIIDNNHISIIILTSNCEEYTSITISVSVWKSLQEEYKDDYILYDCNINKELLTFADSYLPHVSTFKIPAIRHIRALYGLGLKESKDIVEKWMIKYGYEI
jgi:ribosomal protein L7/L12